MYGWRNGIVSFREIVAYALLIFGAYVFRDTIIPFVKNIKKVIAWIILSGIVLMGGMRLGLVPAWHGQESYETLKYVEGRCEYKKRSKIDHDRYYIYDTEGTLLANVSDSTLPDRIEKLHGEHVSIWYKKTLGKHGDIYEISIEGKTIYTVEETNKNIMHVNLIGNMYVYTAIIIYLLFIIDIITDLFKKIVSRL